MRLRGIIAPPFLTSVLYEGFVSFTPRSLYHLINCHRCPLDTKLGGTQSRSGLYGEEKNFLLPESNIEIY
jgi:hypothetical protein